MQSSSRIVGSLILFVGLISGSTHAGDHPDDAGADSARANDATNRSFRLNLYAEAEKQEHPQPEQVAYSTPLMSLATFPDDPAVGWNLHWEQETLLAGAGVEFVPLRWFSVKGLVLVGESRACFHAHNDDLGVMENWETEWDDAWGGEAAMELHRGIDNGPYVRLAWRRIDGGADEDEEFISGPFKSGGEEPGIDVSFTWSDETLSTATGWRFTQWAPELGIRHRLLKIHKTIVAHYPNGKSPVSDLLNTAPAEYWYENDDTWVAFVGARFHLYTRWEFGIQAELADAQTFSTQLQVSF